MRNQRLGHHGAGKPNRCRFRTTVSNDMIFGPMPKLTIVKYYAYRHGRQHYRQMSNKVIAASVEDDSAGK